MRKPTIHDVAARAGVSKSTVSLVLQESPLVKAATREAVMRAMLDLGYVYNAAAAGLRGRTSAEAAAGMAASPSAGAPGFAFLPPPAIPLLVDLAVAEQADFAAALQRVAATKRLGLHLLAQNTPWPGRKISTFRSTKADAQTLTALHPRAQVRSHGALAAARATRHLLGLGALAVAFVGGNLQTEGESIRIRGYTQRMAKAGAASLHLPGGRDAGFGAAAMAQLLAEHPTCTAALCINDAVALGMAEALRARGITPGAGFRLVGWGDTAAAQAAGLSSIRPVWDQLAAYCADWWETGIGDGCEIEPPLIRRASSMGGG